MTFVIGYKEKNNDEFVKHYENLEIDTNNYLQTLLNLELFNRGPNAKLNFQAIVARDNPASSYYHNHQGVLSLTMDLLREPPFSVNYPMYVNYGHIGKIIARKIADNIVVMGEKSTGGINLREINNEKTLCFRQQLENYIAPNDLKNSLEYKFTNKYPSGRISVHIAYKATYRAYQQWTTKYGIEPSLPELPFSNNQLLWIYLIRSPYCFPPSEYPIVIDNKYSIFVFSTMRTVTSIPEFHKDFNCPVNNSFIKNYGPSCTFFEA